MSVQEKLGCCFLQSHQLLLLLLLHPLAVCHSFGDHLANLLLLLL